MNNPKTDSPVKPQGDPVKATFTPSYRGDSIEVERPREGKPDPAPDALMVLREWVQAGHDACMAAGCSRLHPEFRSDNGGWIVVNTDDLLAKIAELDKSSQPPDTTRTNDPGGAV